MITGFNTDVEHEGVVYHVQSEDKGLTSPLILSLVYMGGAILASKRSPYHDLIAAGFDEKVLVKRLERQHILICAAIQAGRIEELKHMGRRENEALEAQVTEKAKAPLVVPRPGPSHEGEVQTSPPVMANANVDGINTSIFQEHAAPQTSASDIDSQSLTQRGALQLKWIDEKQLRAGEFVTLKIRVSRSIEDNEAIVQDASVIVKILGTAFRPVLSAARTDQNGIAVVSAALPTFTTGRAAILIRAERGGDEAEMRRIIHSA